MTDPDFNLLIALDALLTAGSVVGRTASRFKRFGDEPHPQPAARGHRRSPAGARRPPYGADTLCRNAARTGAARSVRSARGVAPGAGALDPAVLDRTFTLRANDGFVEAFGPALIAAAAEQAPRCDCALRPSRRKATAPA